MSDNKNTVTLDFIVQAAEKKFANLTITLPEVGDVVLVNAMQLPTEKRKELMASQKNLSEAKARAEAAVEAGEEIEDTDQVKELEDTLRIVIRGEGRADALISALDGNLAQLATVFEFYSKGTELGEASASAN